MLLIIITYFTKFSAFWAHAMVVYGTTPTLPGVKCVSINSTSYFSVIIKDGNEITADTKVRKKKKLQGCIQ